MPPDKLARFREIQKTISKRYKERNKVIHGAWGISPQYPNDLLWYDPRDSIAMFPELMTRLDPTQKSEREALLEKQKTNLRVYTEQDFIDLIARIDSAYIELEAFTRPFTLPLFQQMKV